VRLLGETLQRLELHDSGRIATVIVTQAMYSRCSASHADTEGLIDYPRSIEGVDASALVRELEGGGFKISLRSRGEINVESVARRHGGGGHHNAAGFNLEGSDAEAVRELVAQELEELLEAGS
jgi:phosphoesterase RecJ-like protein